MNLYVIFAEKFLRTGSLLLTTFSRKGRLPRIVAIGNDPVFVMDEQKTQSLLREVARLHLQLQRASIACCEGVTATQCFILTELGRSGPLTLAELGRRLSLDKGWISRAVDSMAQDGVLVKSPSETDQRSIIVSLSRAGQRCLAQTDSVLDAQAERVVSRIPESKQLAVHKALELLRDAMQAETLTGMEPVCCAVEQKRPGNRRR
jgi:DNA-binding MarR family transcriptional regulator